MAWLEVVLALVRCEFKARYSGLEWQVSAKGVLAVALLAVALAIMWQR